MNNIVSIITPSFNSEKFIKSCIKSVINQTYKNWEMLIVDDCSIDNTARFIKEIAEKDARIKGVYLDKNIGSAAARNIAIQKASGRYIAFLDSDDLWDPEKLEKQISFMKDKSIVFSYSSYHSISEDGSKCFGIIKAPSIIRYNDYLKNTIIGCLTVIIDRYKVGDFEMPNIRSSHDMALWLLIMRRGFDAYGLDESLAKYRIVRASNSALKWRAAKDVWFVYRKIEKLPFFYSIWCFINYSFNAFLKRVL
tara:strand:+ start:503 stop:1255 length:753 start_codon:yes stop_codon:yes gene_type:complete